jgi:hypothetical protein
MIHGGWPFVNAAYAVTLTGLAVLAVIVVLRLRHWSKLARQLDKASGEP